MVIIVIIILFYFRSAQQAILQALNRGTAAFQSALDQHIDWTPEAAAALEDSIRSGPIQARCSTDQVSTKGMLLKPGSGINYIYTVYATPLQTFTTTSGADPEIFLGGWLSGWLHVLYYTELWEVAGRHC